MHITDFLEQAAPAPSHQLDVSLLAARAGRRRWLSRRWAWLAGFLVVGGVAVPIGANLVPASSPSIHVAIEHPRKEAGMTAGDGDATGMSSHEASSPAGAADSRRSTAAVPTTVPASGQPASDRDSCVVNGGENGVDVGAVGGVGVGGYPECEYDAKSAAGYVANGSWEMYVTRPDGRVDHYGPGQTAGPTRSGPACAAVGVVRPGDHVHVTLYQGAENTTTTFYVKVGPGYHC